MKRLLRPAAVFQIPCVEEPMFDTTHDGNFGAPTTPETAL
jgi:hypothetical protein